MRALALAIVLATLLAGCAVPVATPPNTACEAPCRSVLDATGKRNFEPSLATHPTDARKMLVGWTERSPGIAHVWVGVSKDGGATWTKTPLHDPALKPVGNEELYSFDIIVAFAPDGTALAMYGGETDASRENDALVVLTDRITLATSKDDGATWSYHTVEDSAAAGFGADFMDLAVSPDTGHLFVTAQVFTSAPVYFSGPARPISGIAGTQNGVWMWRSTDTGASWDRGTLVHPGANPEGVHGAPRVAAGPNGLVVIVTDAYTEATQADLVWVDVSRDDGRAFESRTLSTTASVSLSAPVIQGTHVAVVVKEGLNITTFDSSDAGARWEPTPLGVSSAAPFWAMGARRASDGTLAALSQSNNACDPGKSDEVWSMDLLMRSANGRLSNRTVAGPSGDAPTKCFASNDYGGLSFAADGHLWGAWSDASDGKNPRIVVERLD